MTNPHTVTTRLVIDYVDDRDLLRQALLELQHRGLVLGIDTLYNGGTLTPVVGLALDPRESET